MSTESLAVSNHIMDSRFSHLSYSWADFETEEDLSQEELYKHAFRSTERDESPSPVQNLDAPLDDQDFEHFERKTARLASISEESVHYGSMPPTPRIEPVASLDNEEFDHEASDILAELPPPRVKFTSSSPERILAAFGWLLDSVAAFEDAIEDRQSYIEGDMMDRQASFEKLVMDVLESLTVRIEQLIDDRLPSGNQGQLTKTGNRPNCVNNRPRFESELHSNYHPVAQWTHSVPSQSQSLLSEKYIHDWLAGGLILIENISQHIPLREIYALFHTHGRISYLELHAADKSQPHLPTRHAYIHYFARSQALRACRALHNFPLHGKTLMVFNCSTVVVRGEPGYPYNGPALEILNFNGGSNYASPEADFRRSAAGDLPQLSEEKRDVAMPVSQPTVAAATYSLKPQLTGKTAAASWRKPDVPVADNDDDEGESDADEAVFFSAKRRWGRLSTPATSSECDSNSGVEDEDGGVYLPSEDDEEGEDEEEDEEDLRRYASVRMLEFL
ncbi:MAG: hypothetical protein LQ346_001817 [Caloplaca aetnensis]|nr:MAG: hypothetical protein LQ346_001817 [Caloplaca aetnensis]